MTDSLLIHNATVCTFGDANRVIEDGAIIIHQAGWRVMRGVDALPGAVVEAWNGLWQGALAVHDRFSVLELLGRPDYGDDGFTWRLRRRPGTA